MSLAIPTGSTRTATCDCGVEVKQREDLITGVPAHPNGLKHWSSERHNAPCGLPCLSAGVRAKEYREKQFHRSADSCPRCKPGSDPTVRPTEAA